MEPEEPSRREEGHRDEDESRVPIAPGRHVGDIRQGDAYGRGAEDEPEVARVVLPLQVELWLHQQQEQADERQRRCDGDGPGDALRPGPRPGVGRHICSIPTGRKRRPPIAVLHRPDGGCHHRAMADRVLSPKALGRTLLARQLLLQRSSRSIPDAVEQVGGLQTQYAPSGYVGLWSRLAGFERAALTTALEDRSVIQATLMRVTIHIVSRREYWPYALGVRQARREQWRRTFGRVRGSSEDELVEAAEEMRSALADGPKTVKELGDLATGFVGTLGLWVDLVRVPPSGTWERRRADRLGLAEDWVGPPDTTEDDGLTQIVRAYLRAFGPAPWKDIASWAGLQVADIRRGAESLDLRRY